MIKKINNTLKKCISLSRGKVLLLVILATISIAYILKPNSTIEQETIMEPPQPVDSSNIVWTPTEEDIAYQDSMFAIVEQTSQDVDTIKKSIEHILLRLEYKDGTYDSIRYVRKNKENQSR